MYRNFLVVLVATASFCLITVCRADSSGSSDSSNSLDLSDSSIECESHETAYRCGTRCELTCAQTHPGHCVGSPCPGYECRCDTGYVRGGPDNECILPENCPGRNEFDCRIRI